MTTRITTFLGSEIPTTKPSDLPLASWEGGHTQLGKSEGLVVRIHTEPKNVSCHPCGDYYWGGGTTQLIGCVHKSWIS